MLIVPVCVYIYIYICAIVMLHVAMFTISHITVRQTALHVGPSVAQCLIASQVDAIRHHQLNIKSTSSQRSAATHSGDVTLAQAGTTHGRNVATVISSEIKLICARSIIFATMLRT